MDRKRKAAVLFCVISVILLGLYRNFGVPVLRFWPLILIDTILRIPGDLFLKLVKPPLPAFAYEMLRGVFQIATVVMFLAFFKKIGVPGRFRGAFSRPRPQADSPAVQTAPPPSGVQRGPRRKLALAGWVAFALLILNGRCGRETVNMLSLLCGVQGHPLHVSTEVFLESPEHKASVDVHFFNNPLGQLFSGSTDAPMSLADQDDLLSRHMTGMPLLRPGKLRFRDAPLGVSLEEAKAVERRALAFLNAFGDLDWDYRADAKLVFSKDGLHAAYWLEISYYEGPLASAGSNYAVALVKVGKDWIVTSLRLTGLWFS